MSDEWQRDLETEARITGKNQHSVYRLCPAHGFGIHGPGEDTCPSCGGHCTLYLSGEDVRQIVKAALSPAPTDGGEVERLQQALSDIQFDLINCPEAAGSRACEHLKDAIRIVNRTLKASLAATRAPSA